MIWHLFMHFYLAIVYRIKRIEVRVQMANGQGKIINYTDKFVPVDKF